MPMFWLCGPRLRIPWWRAWTPRRGRHNHWLSRNARSLSSGWYRPARVPVGVVTDEISSLTHDGASGGGARGDPRSGAAAHERLHGDPAPRPGHEDVRRRKDLDVSLIHISEPTRLGMISYAVFCLKKKNKK